MGAVLCSLARSKKVEDSCQHPQRLISSPLPSFRHTKRRLPGGSLQDVCIEALARHLCARHAVDVDVLPAELIQRVVDALIEQGKLDPPLLCHLGPTWLHRLDLTDHPGVDNLWLLGPVAACKQLQLLDLSGCTAVTDAGLAALPDLRHLQHLSLRNCAQVSDAGLRHVSGLQHLRSLSLEGCDSLTCCGLAALGLLTGLTTLNLEQCARLHNGALRHLSGMTRLQDLSLGWCREIGAPDPHPTAGGAAPRAGALPGLAALTALTQLNLAGTRVGDAALVVVGRLPRLHTLNLGGSAVTHNGLRQLATSTAAASGTAGAGLEARGWRGCGGGGASGPLRRLLLRGCRLGDEGASSLALLQGLECLDLSCCGVGSAGLLALGRLGDSLAELVLDMCPVGDAGCAAFRQLTRLEVLDLSDTDVTDLGVPYLARLVNLTRLSLCNTEVGDEAAHHLARLPRLTSLNIDARAIGDACLTLLRPLAGQLLELDLYGARVSPRGVAALAGFCCLVKLDVCGGLLNDRAAAELAKVRSLRQLSVAQNPRLGDPGLRQLAAGLGPSLEALNVSYTGVSDASVRLLAAMEALRVVVLSGSAVTAGGAERLRKLTPQMLVKWSSGRSQ